MRKSLSSRRNTLMGSQLLERRGSIVRKEEEQDLTQEQIQAFQEAFAIFDKVRLVSILQPIFQGKT